jgi:predicted nucleic acid-binding protein
MKFFLSQMQRMKVINPDWTSTLKTVLRIKVCYYDASYISTAKNLGLELITEDKILRDRISGYVSVLSLSQISL